MEVLARTFEINLRVAERVRNEPRLDHQVRTDGPK
jgi:hypothetical protein